MTNMTSRRVSTRLASLTRFILLAVSASLLGCRSADRWTTPAELSAFADLQSATLAKRFGLDANLHATKLYTLQRAHALQPERFLLLPGVKRLSPAEAQVISSWSGLALSLPDLRTASPATLEHIVKAGGSQLFLGGLSEITPDQARKIAGWSEQGELYLTGLQWISKEVAEVLAEWGTTKTESVLVLDGVDRLSPEAALILMRSKAWALSLGGLTRIDAQLAEAFAGNRRATLRLNGLRTLDTESLPAFERWDVKFLWLDGMQELDVETARAVARSASRGIFFGGVSELTLEVATILSEAKPDSIYMLGVRQLSQEVQEFLRSNPHRLTFNRRIRPRRARLRSLHR